MPLVLSTYLWWRDAISLQNLVYLLGSLLTLLLFVMTLGVHCGIRYANSRAAIGVSMGTFFFLSLGVAICMVMMVSFSDSVFTCSWSRSWPSFWGAAWGCLRRSGPVIHPVPWPRPH